MQRLFHTVDNKILKFLVGFLIVFIPLYPKLPSIGITHTWVYIRLEDFFIAFTCLIWFSQILRKKISINFRLGTPIFIYWFVGLCSLLFSIIFIGPHIANFFPKIAALSYLRRIEYMILFFIVLSTIRSLKDLRDYLIILVIVLLGIVVYGFGQRYYLYMWQLFPTFFEKYPFCFPSFQTGNEEFAKGIPLCLPSDARITSTFAGHYDLGAYLVLVIPILVAILFAIRRLFIRISLFILTVASMALLIFTASRVSFIACILSLSSALIFYNKKRFIVPWILIIVILLFIFNAATAKRLLETVRLTSIVTNSQGQVVGEAESALPPSLRSKISKNPVVIGNVPTQNLPKGSGFISLPQANAPVATSTAVVQTSLSVNEAKKLKLANGGIEISTVSGSFLVQKALVYDISFTTRFQGEWPNAWKAFLRNPALGSGFSSITLASDNDYLRSLGESGFLGLLSFLSIFLMLGIFLKEGIKKVDSDIGKAYLFGFAGGLIGVFINASLIDVFEASKFAETLWILIGIGASILLLYNKEKIDYLGSLKEFFSSHALLIIYLFIIIFVVLMPSINNFFVADDFTWLHWAASSTLHSIKGYFTDASGFFYRPLDKIIMFFLYTFFSFEPQGYHLFTIVLHFGVGVGVYILGLTIFKKKRWAFFASVIFMLLPSSGENLFWLSTISTTVSSLLMVYGLIFFIKYRSDKSFIYYFLALLLYALALLSYEMALIFPILLIISDTILIGEKRLRQLLFSYMPFLSFILFYLGARFYAHAVWPSGSYGYNLLHLLPNVFGNLGGYYSLFLFGDKALPYYNFFRILLRSHSVLVLLLLLMFIFVAIFLGFIGKKKLIGFINRKYVWIITFSFLFSFVALLPFLALGNIAQRYSYLASIGFVFLAIAVLRLIMEKLFVNKNNLQFYISILIVTLWSFSNFLGLNAQSAEWNHAGKITNNTLSVFRLYYANLPKGSNVYVANVPIKIDNAWVFPVGLKDGLWFIYRSVPIHVYEVKDLTGLTPSATTYLFKFNKSGELLKIKSL